MEAGQVDVAARKDQGKTAALMAMVQAEGRAAGALGVELVAAAVAEVVAAPVAAWKVMDGLW